MDDAVKHDDHMWMWLCWMVKERKNMVTMVNENNIKFMKSTLHVHFVQLPDCMYYYI